MPGVGRTSGDNSNSGAEEPAWVRALADIHEKQSAKGDLHLATMLDAITKTTQVFVHLTGVTDKMQDSMNIAEKAAALAKAEHQFRTETTSVIATVQEAVGAIEKKLAAMSTRIAPESSQERDATTTLTSWGKGAFSRAPAGSSSSQEHAGPFPQAPSQPTSEGKANMAHLVLTEDVAPSRLLKGVIRLVKRVCPNVIRGAALCVVAGGAACDHVVCKCSEFDEIFVMLNAMAQTSSSG
jgi:hypothetical protein